MVNTEVKMCISPLKLLPWVSLSWVMLLWPLGLVLMYPLSCLVFAACAARAQHKKKGYFLSHRAYKNFTELSPCSQSHWRWSWSWRDHWRSLYGLWHQRDSHPYTASLRRFHVLCTIPQTVTEDSKIPLLSSPGWANQLMASSPAPAVLVAFHWPRCHPPLSVLSWESQRGPGMLWWPQKYQVEGVHPFPHPPSCILARTAQ